MNLVTIYNAHTYVDKTRIRHRDTVSVSVGDGDGHLRNTESTNSYSYTKCYNVFQTEYITLCGSAECCLHCVRSRLGENVSMAYRFLDAS